MGRATTSLRAEPVTAMPRLNPSEIPKEIKTNIAETVFNAIQLEFQRPEVQADYTAWKAKRAKAVGTA